MANRLARMAVFGATYFISTFVTALVLVFVKCMLTDINFDFWVIWPILLRGSALMGVVAALLASVQAPSKRKGR